jgi:hypothetical protein
VLALLFSDWPSEQLSVLRSLIDTPSSVLAALSMAHEEMDTIKDLDVELLRAHRQKLYFYFAEKDDWVGEQREEIMKALNYEAGDVKVVHGERDIPHAFCISELPPFQWV